MKPVFEMMQGYCVVSFQAVKLRLLHKLIIWQVEGNGITVLSALESSEDPDYPAQTRSLVVGNPNRKKMHIFGFVGIFEYIC